MQPCISLVRGWPCSEESRQRSSQRQIKTTVAAAINKAKRRQVRQKVDDGGVAGERKMCRRETE
ncbi:unnamed protein product [Arabidopsis lyrata]|uniref:Predicted protein n=1 Tax=Arabidopsis lyrata subsp. lyrata TaxID=81972 RepID=D7LJN7_ARALL|nr:predicted protein [Arabidopsis lyrata subsp. lyrata]CAH8264949.1 unnamed protein product [Arabidopsis lyrata]